MNKTTIIGTVIGILLAVGVIGVLGCIQKEAPWCGVYLAAQNGLGSIANNNNPENRNPQENGNQNQIPKNNAGTNNSNTNENTTDGDQQKNIVVTSPKSNDEIGLPLIIKGQARVFKNSVSYRLRDQSGSVLVEGHAIAQAREIGQFGPFEISTSFAKPKGDRGTLEIFSTSARDGAEINKVSIPLRFRAVETTTVKIYLGNKKEDPASLECEETYPVDRRIPKTQSPARAALEELLKGPTAQESERGFFTSINSGVTLQSISIENGTAKADFDAMLGAGVGGSCRVLAIRSQIENTLKQLSGVKNVVISIDGEIEDILQP